MLNLNTCCIDSFLKIEDMKGSWVVVLYSGKYGACFFKPFMYRARWAVSVGVNWLGDAVLRLRVHADVPVQMFSGSEHLLIQQHSFDLVW